MVLQALSLLPLGASPYGSPLPGGGPGAQVAASGLSAACGASRLRPPLSAAGAPLAWVWGWARLGLGLGLISAGFRLDFGLDLDLMLL